MPRLALALVVCLFLALPVPAAPVRAAEPLSVAVSIPPQAWFVRAVAGDLARVLVMIPAGADPHTYEPRPGKMAELSRARLYLALGVAFERHWLPRFRAAAPDMAVADMAEGIERMPMAGHERQGGRARDDRHDQGEPDPHVWLSPRLARAMVENSRAALARTDPAHAAEYAANAGRAQAELAAMDAEFQALFQGLAGRAFMVFHPSWGYFARDYGLIQTPIEVQGGEPSPGELADLVDQAREHKVSTVFVQPQFPRRTAEVVAREIGGRVVVADPLAEDWADNLRRTAGMLAEAMARED